MSQNSGFDQRNIGIWPTQLLDLKHMFSSKTQYMGIRTDSNGGSWCEKKEYHVPWRDWQEYHVQKKDMGYGSQSAKTGEHTRDMDFNLTVKRIGWFKRE